MKNPNRCAADRDLGNAFQHVRNVDNLPDQGEKSNSTDNLARRDAAAMVHLLNKIRSGMEQYECIYESLKAFHGEPFERHFRNYLADKGGQQNGSD